MLRGTTRSLVEAVITSSRHHQVLTPIPRPWVGCSHWTTPFRPLRTFSTPIQSRRVGHSDESISLAPDSERYNDAHNDVWDTRNTEDVGIETSLEGITIDQVDPSDSSHTQTQNDLVNLEPPEENVRFFQSVIKQSSTNSPTLMKK
jgi:hypothetical protein